MTMYFRYFRGNQWAESTFWRIQIDITVEEVLFIFLHDGETSQWSINSHSGNSISVPVSWIMPHLEVYSKFFSLRSDSDSHFPIRFSKQMQLLPLLFAEVLFFKNSAQTSAWSLCADHMWGEDMEVDFVFLVKTLMLFLRWFLVNTRLDAPSDKHKCFAQLNALVLLRQLQKPSFWNCSDLLAHMLHRGRMHNMHV